MRIDREGYPLSFTGTFAGILDKHLAGVTGPATIIFRDPTYSQERGGFRPVEVRVEANGRVAYVTEMGWIGGDMAKTSDFSFYDGLFQDEYHCGALDTKDVKSFWKLWSANFCEYFRMGAYQVEVTDEGKEESGSCAG